MADPLAPGRRAAFGRARAAALLCCASVLALVRPAAALEPGRRFDQYAHAAWPTVAHVSTVHAILPSRTGHLWLGTSEGLIRFDGQRMSTYDVRRFPGIVEREVRSLVEEPDGTLWISSWGRGLSRVTGGTVRSWGAGKEGPGTQTTHLFSASNGALWVAARDGVFRFALRGEAATTVSEGLPHLCTHVLASAGGDEGGLLAGTHAGLARWTGEGWQALHGPPAVAIDALLAERDGTLWVGTRGAGLWSRKGMGAWRAFDVDAGLGSKRVKAILRDRDGHLWVATTGGNLAWLDGDRFRPFPLLPRMCPDRIAALAEDAEGGLWLGTEHCGLHRLSERPFHVLTVEDGLPSDRALGLRSAPDGEVILGTRGGGMARWRPGQSAIQPLRCAADLPCHECWDFSWSARADGSFWTVCQSNVVLRSDAGGVRRLTPLPGGLTGASFALEASDGALWLALGKTVVRQHEGSTTPIIGQEGFKGERILFEGQDAAMWIGADDGVAIWKDGRTRLVRLPPADRPVEVANYHQDAEGTVWMATKGEGIRRARGDRIATIGVQNGLPTGWIVQLLEDDRGRLWASSSKGIFWVNKRELGEIADGQRSWVHASLYDASDGIQMHAEPFGHPAGFKDRQGRLWFAASGGIIVVDPSVRPAAPRVSIDQLRLGGERVALLPGQRVVASGAPRDLDVSYSALTFARPDTVSFRYRLRAGDRGWVDVGPSRNLHHPRLEAGEYLLAIQARPRDGDWGTEVTALAFTLRPPFHRSPAFFGLLVLAAGLVLLALHRARITRTRAGLQAVMAERTRIAREVHDTLAQAFVATSVQLECLEEELEGDPRPKVHRHLATARKVVAESLDEARHAVWVLRPQSIEAGLVPALETLVNRVSGGTVVELQVLGAARELPPLVASNLLRIAHEAVANAHRHARARHVEIRLAFTPASVALSVTDDGEGLAGGGGLEQGAGPGQGILGMKERATQMGGTLSIGSAAQKGTTVHVEVAA